MKWSHDYKGYVSIYRAEILSSFNPELKLINVIESAIKNKLIDLLFELREFKFVATLVLEFKKKNNETMITENIALFIRTQKQKQLLMKVTLMIYLNQPIKHTTISRKRFRLD